jgi:hypothetical protein
MNLSAIATIAAVAIGLGLGVGRLDAGYSYSYTKVADSKSLPLGFVNLDFTPQINESNQVVLQMSSSNSSAVSRWQSGALTTIASTGNAVPGRGTMNSVSKPAISDTGNVAFRATYSSGGGSVLRSSSTGLQEVFNDVNSLNNVRINNADRVLSSVQNGSGNPIEVQSRTVTGTTTIHASNASSGAFSSYFSGGAPSPDFNNNGDVVLHGILRSNSQDGIYVQSAAGVQAVASGVNGLVFFGNNADINNNGLVAFVARTSADPAGTLSVYTGSSSVAPTLVASRSSFTSILDNGPAINDVGDILFQATSSGSSAIFSGGNPLTDRVIGTGDTLDGGKLTGLLFGRGMLNNSGNFVMYAEIDDTNDGISDRTAIFFASVTAVPEPTSIVLSLVAFAWCARFRLRRTVGSSKASEAASSGFAGRVESRSII